MNIGFNGQRLAGQRLGVGRYIEYLLRHWSTMLHSDDLVSLFLRAEPPEDIRTLHPQIRSHVLSSHLPGIPWETLRMGKHAKKQDVLFCPSYTSPLGFGGRTVVATHSVDEALAGTHSWKYRNTYARLYAHSARKAERVIVPSHWIRDVVIERYAVQEDRVVVIPQGADDSFSPIVDPAVLREVRCRFFGRDRPYILFVGKCSPRRNVPTLIRAFAALKHERHIPHGLLLFGPNQYGLPLEALCRELGIEGDVVQTDGRIAQHTEMVPIYSAAELFVHPSSIEGWSMTTAEAMACGAAVVAANRGGLGELARGYAKMVDAPSVESLADAIGLVIEDGALRADLQRLALTRAQSLRWRTLAARTLEVVREAAAR